MSRSKYPTIDFPLSVPVSGDSSLFGKFNGKHKWTDRTAGGAPASGQGWHVPGIALRNQGTLGGYFLVTLPNKKNYLVQHTDMGPYHSKRIVDVNASFAEKAGYTPRGYPTDDEVTVRYLGKDVNQAIQKLRNHPEYAGRAGYSDLASAYVEQNPRIARGQGRTDYAQLKQDFFAKHQDALLDFDNRLRDQTSQRHGAAPYKSFIRDGELDVNRLQEVLHKKAPKVKVDGIPMKITEAALLQQSKALAQGRSQARPSG